MLEWLEVRLDVGCDRYYYIIIIILCIDNQLTVMSSLLLNMNSTNETLLFNRFLIMNNFCVFTCIILIFVFLCTHVRMSYVLNFYLLTCFVMCSAGEIALFVIMS